MQLSLYRAASWCLQCNAACFAEDKGNKACYSSMPAPHCSNEVDGCKAVQQINITRARLLEASQSRLGHFEMLVHNVTPRSAT